MMTARGFGRDVAVEAEETAAVAFGRHLTVNLFFGDACHVTRTSAVL